MSDISLRVGPPTGHNGNHVGTIMTPDGGMVRGQMHPNRWRDLADVLRKGCRATGRTFDYIPHRDQEPGE